LTGVGLVSEGFDPIAIRYLLISGHYQASLNFTKETLKGAWESVVRIRNFVRRMDEAAAREADAPDTGAGSAADEVESFVRRFTEAIDDDLNMSKALGHVFDFMRETNKRDLQGTGARAAADAMRGADEMLGILEEEAGTGEDAEIEALVQERIEARKGRNFARSDEIRDQLAARGIILEDMKEGTRWYRK